MTDFNDCLRLKLNSQVLAAAKAQRACQITTQIHKIKISNMPVSIIDLII